MNKLQFSSQSKEKLSQCDDSIRSVIEFALSIGLIDMIVIETIRGKAAQNRYFDIGRSMAQWPDGKHNVTKPGEKSKAIDIAPWVDGSISWKKEHCIFMAGIILTCAEILKIKIRWGGNWDMDREPVTDQDFQDLVHFELLEA